MNPRAVVVGFLVLVAPLTAHAAPFAIQVLSATCSTSITLRTPSVTQTTSECPASQTLDFGVPGTLDASAHAFASADYFATSVTSQSQRTRVDERADSLLTFSPLADGTALLGIDYMQLWFTSLSFSLFDVTIQQLVWEQQWLYGGAAIGSMVVSTDFSAAHQYALQLHTDGNSAGDGTQASLRVSGLVAVPEPSSLLLLSTGLAGVGVFMRARTRKPS